MELLPVGIELNVDGKPRHLLFSIKAIYEIEEFYNEPVINVLRGMLGADGKSYNYLWHTLTILLNNDVELHNIEHPDDKWEKLSDEYVGLKILTLSNIGAVAAKVIEAFNAGMPKRQEDDDTDPTTSRRTS